MSSFASTLPALSCMQYAEIAVVPMIALHSNNREQLAMKQQGVNC